MPDDLCGLLASIGQAPPRTVSELARALGQDRNAVAAWVAVLVGAGLVSRWRVPEERRIVLSLTSDGVVRLAVQDDPLPGP